MYRAALLVVHCFLVLEKSYCWNVFTLLYKRGAQNLKKVFNPSFNFPKAYDTKLILMYKHLDKTVIAHLIFAKVFSKRPSKYVTCSTQKLIRWHNLIFDIFINCNWVVTRWQYTFTHNNA